MQTMEKKIAQSLLQIKAIKLNKQFTKLKVTFSSGKIYFGMYTFLNKGAEESTLPMATEVASLKKLNKSCPIIRYTEKFLIPALRISMMVENTITITTFIKRGFSTLQITPKTLRRYFNLKSRPTKLYNR